jgi:osmoprotectant transport system ATP-binding protein
VSIGCWTEAGACQWSGLRCPRGIDEVSCVGHAIDIVTLALQADTVSHSFGDTPALSGVSLEVARGTLTALVGESGSGKTTLLRCFNRMVEPRSGAVRVAGRDIRTMDPVALRRTLGYVPQHGGLLPHWTIMQNVELVARLIGAPDAGRSAREALAHVGLDAGRFGERLPGELSGGQRQRAALARALAARQDSVLLDEPFGALDAISRGEVLEAFARARQELGFTALLVTHDLGVAARLADRIVVMRTGRVEQAGSIDELRTRPATGYVQELFERARAALAVLS